MDYKETFLRCVEEGYDAAKASFKEWGTARFGCPYTLPEQSYEYNAWHSGHDWYCAEVH